MSNITPENETKIISARTVYQGYIKVIKLGLSRNDELFSRELVSRGNSVCALLYDDERDKVLLTMQFRPGASPQPGPVIECVAGMIDPNEAALEAIVREVFEETTLRVEPGRFRKIGTFMLSPGVLQETTTVFIAPCAWAHLDLQAIYGESGEQESIQLVELDFSELAELLRRPDPVSATLHIATTFLWDVLI